MTLIIQYNNKMNIRRLFNIVTMTVSLRNKNAFFPYFCLYFG